MYFEKRKLKNIKIHEVSYVGHPANRKRFFFWKDMGKSGRLVCPGCGYETRYDSADGKAPRRKCPECGRTLVCAQKQTTEESTMLMEKDTHVEAILKSFDDRDELDDIKLEDEYEGFMGDKMDEEQLEKVGKLSPKVMNAIKAAFRTLNQYKDSLPKELADAVSLMAKITTGKSPYPRPYKKSEDKGEDDQKTYTEEDLEKAGKQVSKAMAEKLLSIRKILDDILGPEAVKKAMEDAQETNELELLKEIHTHLVEKDEKKEKPKEKSEQKPLEKEEREEEKEEEKEEKKSENGKPKPSAEIAEVLKELTAIGDRLVIVEKTRGVRKGLETDGSGDEDDKKKLKKSGEAVDEIPSWNIED